ncbi:MAG: hydroxysqualene dehydroxylase HpnE [Elusimicrobiota bacterium]
MESISDALVIGAGVAGLSCAAALCAAGADVIVLEKKPHPGGRAYSFRDPDSGETLDNGQHLFLDCYRETRRFLERIDAARGLLVFPGVRVDFADARGRRAALSCPEFLGAPWHLLAGVLRLSGLSLLDKAGLSRLDRCVRKNRLGPAPADLDRMSASQWLTSLGQSARVQERLLNPIALGALNEDPSIAAATGLFQVLREAFYRDVRGARPALARAGLSDLYAFPAARFIAARGSRLILRSKVSGLIMENGRVAGARTDLGEVFRARAVVSSLPPWDAARLDLPLEISGGWRSFRPSPIISVNLWTDRPVLGAAPFFGMIGTEIQWAFNKGRHLCLVMSGARKHINRSPADLASLAESDLRRCFPEFLNAKVLRYRVIKEPFATLSPTPGTEALRPRPGRAAPGFYWAGDWTSTGLPATIESAAASGHLAAADIIKGE